MRSCHSCKNAEERSISQQQRSIFTCDACKKETCVNCANVSASEQRCLILRNRVLMFFCCECLKHIKLPDIIKTLNEIVIQNKAFKDEFNHLQDKICNMKDIPEIAKLNEITDKLKMLEEKRIETQIKFEKELNEKYEKNKKRLQDINKRMDNIDKTVDSLNNDLNKKFDDFDVQGKAKYSDIVKQNSNLQTRVEKIEAHPTTRSTSELPTLEPVFNEIEERKMRAKNVLIFGLTESSGDKETRTALDKAKAIDFLKKADNTLGLTAENIQITRLGKFEENKLRPLKIILDSSETALALLRGKNKLDQNSPLYIKSDRTPSQREHMKKLTEELNLRVSNGETNLVIKYRNNIPTIIRIHQQKN